MAETIRPLNPLGVYFHQSDVGHAIRRTAAERGEELGVRYQVEWKLRFPYAVDRRLEGLEGLSSLYVDYRRVTDALFAGLTLDKLAIEEGFANCAPSRLSTNAATASFACGAVSTTAST